MAGQRVVWMVKGRSIQPRNDEVSSLGLNVTYQDRECDIHIFPSQPLRGQMPVNEVAMDEFRRLRDALNSILDGQ